MVDEDPVKSAIANMVVMWSAVAWACDGRVEEVPGALACDASAPNPVLNRAVVTDPDVDPAALADGLHRFYRDANGPWVVVDASDRLQLEDLGFERILRLPGMRRRPRVRQDVSIDGLAIEQVRDREGMLDFKRVLFRGFEPARWPEDPGTLFDERLVADDRALFVGRVDGDPVGCSVAVDHDGSIGVYLVAVVPDHRRRGFGEAMSWAATFAFGEKPAYLQASAMGRPVYERMGFETVSWCGVWAPAAASGTRPSLTERGRVNWLGQ